MKRTSLKNSESQDQAEESARLSARDLLKLLRVSDPVSGPLDQVMFAVKRVRRGESLYRAGDRFNAIYVVRNGFFKTVMFDQMGAEQVLGFPMQADLLGADGLADGTYSAEPIALEDTDVVIVPFQRLEWAAKECPGLEHVLYRAISRELVRDQGIQWILGTMGAEGRVAAFVLGLADRFGTLGYSRTSFHLRMTRQEIGSYLGVKLETVSRALSNFATAGWVTVNLKAIEIHEPAALRALFEHTPSANLSDTVGSRRNRNVRPLQLAA